jgi:uncharacterized protein (DUF433 family)
MGMVIQSDPVPLIRDEHGTIRVGGTRVQLELVVEAYKSGASPQDIARWFDSLRVGDVYAVIGYYLNHEAEVEDYLREREAQAAEVRRKIEASQTARPDFRAELLARRATSVVTGPERERGGGLCGAGWQPAPRAASSHLRFELVRRTEKSPGIIPPCLGSLPQSRVPSAAAPLPPRRRPLEMPS